MSTPHIRAMFQAISRMLQHSRRIKELETAVATLQDSLTDALRAHQKLEDHVERGFGRLFKRMQRDEPSGTQQPEPQRDVRPTASQFFTGRRF